MHMKFSKTLRDSRGQSLVETLLTLPLLLIVCLNAMNFGYFFLMALNIVAAPHSGALYAIEGSSTPAAQPLPPSGSPSTPNSVSYLTYNEMTGAINNPTSASIRVCTPINTAGSPPSGVNGTGASQKSNCVTCTSSSCGAVDNSGTNLDPDPEAPNFVLNRVQVTYTFTPLVNVPGFTIPLSWIPFCSGANGDCTITRNAQMRSMQ
jgi:hypothetical protein